MHDARCRGWICYWHVYVEAVLDRLSIEDENVGQPSCSANWKKVVVYMDQGANQ